MCNGVGFFKESLKNSLRLHGWTLLFQFLYLQMSVELGKDLAVGDRAVITAAVQYLFFTYFTISGQNKLAMSKEN